MRPRPDPVTRLGDLLERFFAHKRQQVDAAIRKAATVEFYKFALNPWADAVAKSRGKPVAEILIDELLPDDVDAIQYCRHKLIAVHALFNFGLQKRLIVESPFAGVKLPREMRQQPLTQE